jgi:hypothetical protein
MNIDPHAARMGNQTVPTRRITANIPTELLQEAQAATKQGITETLVMGLQALVRKDAAAKAFQLKGKLRLKEDQGRRDGGAGR